MADKDNIDSKTDEQGRNVETIHCTFCPSKMLNDGVGKFVNIDVSIAINNEIFIEGFVSSKEENNFCISVSFTSHFTQTR